MTTVLCSLLGGGSPSGPHCVQHGTPLGAAAQSSEIAAAEELIKAGADVNGGKHMTPLALAAKYGRVAMIKLLAKHGAKVNDPIDPPLHWAGEPAL